MMRNQLINRLGVNDIYSLCLQTQGKENNCLKEELYQLTFDENDRVSFNALWALSHFDKANNPWLFQKHDDLIDRVLVEKNETKRRLMLQLLLRQPFEEESLRSDFIDFCIAKITACSQPYAIRCYCMKLAYEQMKYYPVGYAGARGSITRNVIGKKANYEENQAKPWKFREIVVTLQT